MENNEKPGFLDSLQQDPNFIYILISAAIWVVGAYMFIPVLDEILATIGFAATCFTTAISALKRPTATAWPGVIAGVVIRIVARVISLIPIINILSTLLSVAGSVLILFFVIPLALQHGEEILEETLKKFHADKEEQTQEGSEDTEEPTTESGNQ